MANFWQVVQPTVWAPGTAEVYGYDCEVETPDYGPHRTWRIDRSGHHILGREMVRVIPKGNPIPYLRCECGWFDHELNYQQLHYDTLDLPQVWVYS